MVRFPPEGGRAPGDLVSEFIEGHHNFFPRLEDAAMEFRRVLTRDTGNGEASLLASVADCGDITVEVSAQWQLGRGGQPVSIGEIGAS